MRPGRAQTCRKRAVDRGVFSSSGGSRFAPAGLGYFRNRAANPLGTDRPLASYILSRQQLPTVQGLQGRRTSLDDPAPTVDVSWGHMRCFTAFLAFLLPLGFAQERVAPSPGNSPKPKIPVAAAAVAGDPIFLRRELSKVQPQPDDLTAGAREASYRPLFGAGDKDAVELQTVARYGELTLPPGAKSALVDYPAEEQIYFVLEGSGTLLYGSQEAGLKKNDFAYLPAGVRHGVANSSTAPLRIVVMGYRIPEDVKVEPTPRLMLANADDVPLQALASHGPTTQFKLLMGLTSSTRDKLSSAHVMNSLFIMDFAPGGTNIPHNHRSEEEIYLLLRGHGEMVAGKDAAGKEVRYPVTEGAAFFYKPGTQVGYYSGAREGDPHDLILAARSWLPRQR
jgi:mannose-6-phosphate isomerase-like protein (cupin superfamily)